MSLDEIERTIVRKCPRKIPHLNATHLRWNMELIESSHLPNRPRWHILAVDSKNVGRLVMDCARAIKRNTWIEQARAYQGTVGNSNYKLRFLSFDSDSQLDGFETRLYEILSAGPYGTIDVRQDDIMLKERIDSSINTAGVASSNLMNLSIERRYNCRLVPYNSIVNNEVLVHYTNPNYIRLLTGE